MNPCIVWAACGWLEFSLNTGGPGRLHGVAANAVFAPCPAILARFSSSRSTLVLTRLPMFGATTPGGDTVAVVGVAAEARAAVARGPALTISIRSTDPVNWMT